MPIVKYDGARIQRLTREGLEYVDDDGATRFIDFSICHTNFMKEVPLSGTEGPRCVGFRDFAAKPPSISSLTDPPTRFEFPQPGSRRPVSGRKFVVHDPEDYREFHEFQGKLLEVGVTTGDLA